VIVVEEAGLRTTVQDLGRPGLAHLGVPRSGAADLFSLRLANALVGNADAAAGIETTLIGPSLRFDVATVAALAGAPASALLDDEPVTFGTSFAVRAGQRLRVGRASAGLRSYLAVAGGVDLAPVLGSRSTDTLSGLGPPPLARGDALRVGAQGGARVGAAAGADVLGRVLPSPQRPVRVLAGPDDDWFSADAMRSLCGGSFVVSVHSDRVGARLAGPALERVRPGEAPTAAMVGGAIQAPPDGAPIVLLADHAVTGGYPVIAVVISADLPLVAQARPGMALRFARASTGEALDAIADAEAALAVVRDSASF